MSKIVINSQSSGKYRTEVVNNRPHLVVSALAAEGNSVMNGILYTKSFLEKIANTLNLKQAPLSHPEISGQMADASHPVAINSNGVGAFVLNSFMQGDNLMADIAIDVEVAQRTDSGKELVRRIENGEPIGVSTGLDQASLVKESGESKGKSYVRKIVEGVFNHLAILLTEKPAGENTFIHNEESDLIICNADISQNAGDSKPNREVNQMDKDKLVLAAIGNSSTTLAGADKDNLQSMSEESFVSKLINSVTPTAPTVEDAQKVIEGAGMVIANSEYNAEEFSTFLANKESFTAFQAEQLKAKTEKVEQIVANSKMSKEQVESLSDDGIENLLNSLTPKQDYSAQGQSVTNASRATGETQVDYS